MKKLLHLFGTARRQAAAGFTLIELMVAIVILGIMMLAITQLMNGAATVTLAGFRHMSADSQARLALDRISFDVARMVKRTDVDYYFPANQSGATDAALFNDQMVFFSESGGYYPTGVNGNPAVYNPSNAISQGSSMSLIGYRIATSKDPTTGVDSAPQLQRLSKGLVWNGSSSGKPMVFLPSAIISTSAWPDVEALTGNNDPDYQVIGDQIFRMEITFLMQKTYTDKNGVSNTVTGFSSIPNLENVQSSDAGTGKGYFNAKQVSAIIVSIAVLDARSQKSLPAGALATAALNFKSVATLPLTPANPPDPNNTTGPAQMPTTSDPSKLPLFAWNQALITEESNNPKTPFGLPKTAAAQIRFYQRYCYLNQITQ